MIIHPLQRTTPEAVGISSRAILAFVDEAEAALDELHSFMLLRHGKVAAEGWWKPYAPHLPHMLFSLSKSFTSTAIGLAVAEGRLSIDDPVLKFFPEEAPPSPSENLKAMRLRQLLSMSTGQGYGNLVIVENGPYRTYYAHLSEIPVRMGEHVSRGDVVGLSGNTGNSTGPHLHYEIRYEMKPLDPTGQTLR
ncbi:membrane proteins related to metalloendopeptidases [Anaerolinea thermolimosa]|uniref:peptidoglycan DD-metalloendopeptidase family protein n=1 Tax=Anaerolinea thermolimosa TaxID=229919 RepID=UPI00078555D9|nr:peptidoglycan DD-metalloendopeptidase family protein [Anaerolinea thermolimosa]GAP07931.1 membrane proteins related to metalloendopeptidases [Anaerolinea thermolimosa]